MTKYRISVSLDGKNFFWVVVDREILIRNPTKEDLYGTKLVSYNETNICPICIEEYKTDEKELTDNSILYPKNARHLTDSSGKLVDEYVCKRHGLRNYQRYDRCSQSRTIKLSRDHRTGNLDPNSNSAKGDNFEELTSRWLGIKRLSVEYDKYSRLPLDHTPIPGKITIKIGDIFVDLSGKILETKGRFFDIERRYWSGNWTNEHGKLFDYLIFYCASEDGKVIERIYIIPREEVEKRTGVAIVNMSNRKIGPWYENYITNYNDTIKVNEIWTKIISGLII